MTTGNLPEQSESQRIGAQAERCFIANHPLDWTATNLAGTDDFGFDYLVQTLPGQRATDTFKAQLKGTQNPKLSADGSTYSIQLKASTVRYYARSTESILLVVADLSVSPSPKNCPLFYCWIHKELARINADVLPDEQQYVTLHVPTANRLDENTDLSADLQAFKLLANVGQTLDLAIARSAPLSSPSERVSFLTQFPASIDARGASLVEALSTQQASAWVNPPVGSLAWHLLEAQEKVKTGDAANVLAVLDQAAPMLAGAAMAELPEYWFLRGRALGLQGDGTASLDAYAEALKYGAGQAKYVAAWAETSLRVSYEIDGLNDYSNLLSKLDGADPVIVEIRSRILAAEGKYEEAAAAAAGLPPPERYSAEAIILTMQGKSSQALAVCDEGLASAHIKVSTRQLFLVLKARALFFLSIAHATIDPSQDRIPPSGLPETDFDLLAQAWTAITEAVEAMRSAGWPPNIDFLADIWPAAASMLGKQEEILAPLMHAAQSRPTILSLHAAVESIAAQSGKFDIALRANQRQVPTDELLCKRIALLHSAKKDAECVALFDQLLDELPATSPMFSEALSVAILSADRIARTDLVAKFRERFVSVKALAPAIASADYFIARSHSPLHSDQALHALEQAYESLGRPFEIGAQIFHILDASRPDQAQKCLVLAESLKSRRLLHIDGALHLAQAFLTLGRWQDLLDLSTGSLRRFEGSERLAAVEAVALDRLGRTAEARAALEKLIQAGANEPMALNAYVNLAARSGFVEEAIATVETILSGTTAAREKVECLRLLFNLRRILDPEDSRTVDLALRIGSFSDQSNESDEGAFLSMLVTATLIAGHTLNPTQQAEFEGRLSAFFAAFPNSAILRKGEFRQGATSDDILATIKSIVGADENVESERRKLENEMRAGRLPVPFAWRPKQILPSIPDVAYLWEVCKRSQFDERQFHLMMTPGDWTPMQLETMRLRTPLIDLTSLMVAQDLGILEGIFDLFPKVAIGQATLMELARLTAPLSGSPFRNRCIALQDFLKTHFDRISQPFVQPPDRTDSRRMRWPSEEVRSLASTEKYLLYSDDMIFRVLCSRREASDGICAMDILSALETTGALTTRAVAEKISQLCAWKVHLSIGAQYQEAILPLALADATSATEGAQMVRSDQNCMSMMDAIWDIGHPYPAFQAHGGALLLDLAAKDTLSTTAVASLMGVWFYKAKLREQSPRPPLRILCMLILQAGFTRHTLDPAVTRRVFAVFLQLVELEHGATMDESKERQAIAMLGAVCAELSLTQPETAGLNERLAAGLTAGTIEADSFNNAFTQELIRASGAGDVPK